MNKLSLTLSLVVIAGSAFAQNNNNTVVRWRQIIGNITAPGIDNPVAGVTDANGNTTNPIHSGTLPWTTKGGSARVNLSTGEGSFDVEGLVLNGGNASGTPGAVKSIVGTLVCNPGTSTQVILDTPATDLTFRETPSLRSDLAFLRDVQVPCF